MEVWSLSCAHRAPQGVEIIHELTRQARGLVVVARRHGGHTHVVSSVLDCILCQELGKPELLGKDGGKIGGLVVTSAFARRPRGPAVTLVRTHQKGRLHRGPESGSRVFTGP